MLPEDVGHFEPVICLCPSMDRRSALWSELCSWLFCPCSCLLKTALARSTVDFPRRCPLPGIVRVPFRKEEFAVISRYFKSRYHDSAPSAEAPRYQTAGSIGALARDEPVTPGVTFLSHPAPNSED